MLSRPPLVPLAEFQKNRCIRTNHEPEKFRIIAEMNDVELVFLFLDCYAISRACIDKSSSLQCVRRPGRRGMANYFCDHRGIWKPFDQLLKVYFFDDETAGSRS